MAKDSITLTARPRKALGKNVNDVRRAGSIPGILYGHAVKNQPIECTVQEFHKVYVKAGESSVVELTLEEKTIPVLIHAIAFEPVTGNYDHIDFLALDMSKEVTTHVPVRTVGEAPGVKELGGVLVHNRDSLTIKCLPKNLPQAIEVDLSSLKNFHDTVTVATLKMATGVTILENPTEIVVSLQPPRKEEEVTVVAAVTAEDAVAEGATPAEGAAAAATSEAPDKEKKGKEDKKGK